MSRILITGGAGFIGSHLVRELANQGHSMRVLDVLMRGDAHRIQDLIDSSRYAVELIDGDIRYRSVVDSAMQNIEYVFHMAATNINRSRKYLEESFDINFRGSQNVFESAHEHDVKKIIFSSSASVYGQPEKLPMSEEDETFPVTAYCVSKLASEKLLKVMDLNYVALRYFNVYGSGQNTDAYYTSVISLFIDRLLKDESPVILGDGGQSMDFIHVRDVVRANILAMEKGIGVFNVASGESTTINELAYILMDIVGVRVAPIFEPRNVLVTQRRADVRKAYKNLGFVSTVKLRKGLEELVKWHVAEKEL